MKLFKTLVVAGGIVLASALSMQAQTAAYLYRTINPGTNALTISGGYTNTPTTAAGTFSNSVIDLALYKEVGLQLVASLGTNYLITNAVATAIVDTNLVKSVWITSLDRTNWDLVNLNTLQVLANGTNKVTITTNLIPNSIRFMAPYYITSASTNSGLTFQFTGGTKPNRSIPYSAP